MAEKLSTAEIFAQIRAKGAFGSDGSGATADVEPTKEAAPSASAPSAPASPLDAIRASGSTAKAPAKKTAPAGSPLDAIRAAGAKSAAKPVAGGSPLDAIRASGGKSAAAKPAGGGSPLDAIRAGGSSKSPAKTAAKPAKKAAPKAVGDLPSAADMLKAARGVDSGQSKPVVASAPRAVKPIKKPAAAKGKQLPRRSVLVAVFCTPFAIAWWLFSIASTAFLLGCARFMMPNVLVEPPTKFKIGPPTDYPPDTVSTKWKAARGVWIVNTDQYNGKRLVYALASVCTHLGCTPGWLEGEQKYKCPCHGSGFYINGINFEGPAPRPLERVGIRLAEDGMLEVDKSKKFQQEMGQWEDPTSFFPVG